MNFEALILNSGEWLLSQELPTTPWHLLIYRQRGSPKNELHVWLPRREESRRIRYAFRRYWEEGSTRWCVEIPLSERTPRELGPRWVRFTAPDGRVFRTTSPRGRGLADLSDAELAGLLRNARGATHSSADHQ